MKFRLYVIALAFAVSFSACGSEGGGEKKADASVPSASQIAGFRQAAMQGHPKAQYY